MTRPLLHFCGDVAAVSLWLLVKRGLGLHFVAFSVVLSTFFILAAERLVSTLKSNPKIMRGIDYAFAGVFGIFALTIISAQAKT